MQTSFLETSCKVLGNPNEVLTYVFMMLNRNGGESQRKSRTSLFTCKSSEIIEC